MKPQMLPVRRSWWNQTVGPLVFVAAFLAMSAGQAVMRPLAFVTDNLTVTTNLTLTGATLTGFPATAACAAGQAINAIAGTGLGTCAVAGITNAAGNNVVPKSNGTNLVASGLSDDGTTVSTSEAVNITGSTTVGDFRETLQTNSTTGAQNDVVLNATTTVWVWSGASTSTISGFKCGAADCTNANANGRHLTVINTTSQILNILNQSGLSAAGNKMTTWTAQNLALSLNVGEGATEFVYDGSITSWRMVGFMSGRIDAAMTFASTMTTVAVNSSASVTATSSIVANATGAHFRNIIGSNDSVTSCGSAPSPTVTAADGAGRITIGGSGATGCTITFTNTYTNPPACTVTFESSGVVDSYAPSATNLVVSSVGSLAGLTFDYVCIGTI